MTNVTIPLKIDYYNKNSGPISTIIISILLSLILRKNALTFTNTTSKYISTILRRYFDTGFSVVQRIDEIKEAPVLNYSADIFTFIVIEDNLDLFHEQLERSTKSKSILIFVSKDGYIGNAIKERTRFIENLDLVFYLLKL